MSLSDENSWVEVSSRLDFESDDHKPILTSDTTPAQVDMKQQASPSAHSPSVSAGPSSELKDRIPNTMTAAPSNEKLPEKPQATPTPTVQPASSVPPMPNPNMFPPPPPMGNNNVPSNMPPPPPLPDVNFDFDAFLACQTPPDYDTGYSFAPVPGSKMPSPPPPIPSSSMPPPPTPITPSVNNGAVPATVPIGNHALKLHEQDVKVLEQHRKASIPANQAEWKKPASNTTPVNGRADRSHIPVGSRALQDYSMHLMLLDKEHKAKKLAEKEAAAASSTPPANSGADGATIRTGNHALQDYQMQLMLLEHQNKVRKQLAEKAEAENAASTTPSVDSNEGVETPVDADNPALRPYQLQLKPLEDQMEARKPRAETSANERPPPPPVSAASQDFQGGAKSFEHRPIPPFRRVCGQMMPQRMPSHPGPPVNPVLAQQNEALLARQKAKLLSAGHHTTPTPPKEVPGVPVPDLSGAKNHALQDWQMQLMLLEQQNKKRLLMARQEQDFIADQNARGAIAKEAEKQADDGGKAPQIDHAKQDYELQLMLLEQQNKKRLLMARMEQDRAAENASLTNTMTEKTVETSESVPQSNGSAKQNFDLRLKLLEQQNNNRLEMARQNHAKRGYELQLMLLEQQNKGRQAQPRQVPAYATETPLASVKTESKAGESVTPVPSQKSGEKIARVVEGMPQHIDLLYHIVCNDDTHTHQDRTFRDKPELMPIDASGDRKLRRHWSGTLIIDDLDAYLEDSNDGMCAVVIRTARCDGAHKSSDDRNGGIPLPPSPVLRCGNVYYSDYDSEDECESPRPKKDLDALEWKESFHFKTHFVESTINSATECHFEKTEQESRQRSRQTRRRANRKGKQIEEPEHIKNQLHPEDLWFYHHRMHLQQNRRYEQDPKIKSYITSLLDYIDLRHGKDFEEADKLIQSGMINRKHALKLFRPNHRVITEYLGQPTAFKLQEWPYKDAGGRYLSPCSGDGETVNLTCWLYQSNGTTYSRSSTTLACGGITVEPTPINKLTVYPTRFGTTGEHNLLIERGEKAWGLQERTPITYTGWDVGKKRYFSNARFIIDRKCDSSYQLGFGRVPDFDDFSYAQPPAPFPLGEFHEPHPFDKAPVRLDAKEKGNEEAWILTDPTFAAFSLDENKWCTLLVDGVHPAQHSKKAFERLVLSDQIKDVIKTLVTIYTAEEETTKREDGAKEKGNDIPIRTNENGNALLMLLHGAPGTGKTFAANAIAEAAGVPLFRVPCVDAPEHNNNGIMHQPGGSPTAVERCIQDAIKFGQKWKCVLLLDDADFFLGQRCAQGDKTTPPSSAILRMLQEYKGVVILTTANLDAFDDSFLSRMQAVVHFKDHDREGQETMWLSAFKKLQGAGVKGDWDDIFNRACELADKDFNGHQIQTILTTARQLAKYRGERLEWKHFQQALTVSMKLSDRSSIPVELPDPLDDWGFLKTKKKKKMPLNKVWE